MDIIPDINYLKSQEITEFVIGFERLYEWANPLYSIQDNVFTSFNFFLSSNIFGRRYFYHAMAFFKVRNENNYGLLVEYGKYYTPSEHNNKYNNFDFYYPYNQEGGLRYKIITFPLFKAKTDDFIRLEIKLERPITFNQLLNEILRDKVKWNSKEYHFMNHNCQKLVNRFIKILKAERRKGNMHDGREYHNYSLSYFPKDIIEELEKNERDSNLSFNKIPIIGHLYEGINIIAEDIKYIFN